MKTIRLLAIALMAFAGAGSAFGQAYEKGDKQLNIGVGLGSQFVAAGASGSLPIGLSFEVGATDKLSFGAYAGYAGATLNTGFGGDWKYQYILAAARGSYHFDFGVENLDPYAGIMLGYNIASVKTNGSVVTGASAGGVLWGAHAGTRYYFGPKFGIFGELGYGIAWLNAGVTFKF